MKVALTVSVCFALLSFALGPISRAQFSPAFLQNDSYWGDGKAEVDFYDAQVMRDGSVYHTELEIILAAATFAPEPTADSQANGPASPLPVIRMSQILTVPLGLVTEQRASVVFFRPNGDLLRAQSSFSNAERIVATQAFHRSTSKGLTIQAFWPGGRGDWNIPEEDGVVCMLRDELPLRVRTLDFAKSSGEFGVRLVPRSSDGKESNAKQRLRFNVNARAIVVDIGDENSEGPSDHLVLDRNFPFLLREWKAADGSTYRLKNSLKVDYQKYLKEGDREKALKDPMLRHPD